MDKNRLVNKLKYYRKKLNITQKELSEELQINPSYYSRIENGSILPNIKLCLEIRDTLKKTYAKKTNLLIEKISVDRLFLLEEIEEDAE